MTALLALVAGQALAQDKAGLSVSRPAEDNSVAAELSSFEIAEGYDVSLFASEENGIANPIAMRWGPRGRLWVLCSLVYPQIVPTDRPDDKLYILEDTDHDGRADTTMVYADGLDMPTGFALGDGGVYLGEGDDLVFLTDTNADGRADTREVILSGFGTGDTHQNINSFTWSPGGELLFCQGLHNFSRVETPWGIVRMDEHGVWRLRPKRRQLHAFRGGSGQNPWGIAFGQWGEPFVKGNNTELSELLPVMVPTENRHNPLDIGRTQIKSMICEIVDSPALPDDLQGDILIAGYFGHLVDRLKMSTDGSGHRGELLPPLFRTSHPSFRPVDIQTGPDGALYVADWYNPIIGHYQASFRHPDRDKNHGRIWRVTAKGRKLATPVNFEALPTQVLLERLETAPLKERERIRLTLSNRDSKTVLVDVAAWIRGLDQSNPNYEHHLFEALCLYEWNETVNRALLDLLLAAKNPLARAYATRVVGRWHDRIEDPLALLESSIADPHPRVRLEAVVAASALDSPEALTVATRALDQPMDRFLTAALVQSTHALKDRWWPALMAGTLHFASPAHLSFVLPLTSGKDAAATARNLLRDPSLAPEVHEALLALLALNGNAADLQSALAEAVGKPAVLAALVDSARLRPVKPAGDLRNALEKLLAVENAEERAVALRLIGLWQINGLENLVRENAVDRDGKEEVRRAALETMGLSKDATASKLLATIALEDPAAPIRRAALLALTAADLARAAETANALLRKADDEDTLTDFITPFLGRKNGPEALARSLSAQPLTPALAGRIRTVLGAAGRHSPALESVLAPQPVENAIGIPAYSEQFVSDLTAEVKASGNAERGSKVYHRDSLACTMCHVIDVCGLPVGPELTAVGAGVPIELLIEAVLWPERQVKEGFLSSTLTTKSGQIVSGFVQTDDQQRIVIRDAAGVHHTIAPREIASRQDAGTIMPPGLTAQLTRGELRDLVRFLSERKGQKKELPTP